MTSFPAARAAAIAAVAALSNCARTQSLSSVSFERTPCYGTCPVYRVAVSGSESGRGSVRFEGIRNVDSVGTFTAPIDAAAMAKLARAFEDAKYFTLESKYGRGNCSPYFTDASSILTSVSTPERSKTIEHDLGCGQRAPAALAELYKKFDEIVGVSRWIGKR